MEPEYVQSDHWDFYTNLRVAKYSFSTIIIWSLLIKMYVVIFELNRLNNYCTDLYTVFARWSKSQKCCLFKNIRLQPFFNLYQSKYWSLISRYEPSTIFPNFFTTHRFQFLDYIQSTDHSFLYLRITINTYTQARVQNNST